jgi:hypothetical protein
MQLRRSRPDKPAGCDAASGPPDARAAILSATKSTAVVASRRSILIERRSRRSLSRLQGRCWPEWQFHDTAACRTAMGLHRAYCVTILTKWRRSAQANQRTTDWPLSGILAIRRTSVNA